VDYRRPFGWTYGSEGPTKRQARCSMVALFEVVRGNSVCWATTFSGSAQVRTTFGDAFGLRKHDVPQGIRPEEVRRG
jgi:hypothetical protein